MYLQRLLTKQNDLSTFFSDQTTVDDGFTNPVFKIFSNANIGLSKTRKT